MATDHLTLAGAAGLLLILTGLGWQASGQASSPVAVQRTSFVAAPGPLAAAPRTAPARLLPKAV